MEAACSTEGPPRLPERAQAGRARSALPGWELELLDAEEFPRRKARPTSKNALARPVSGARSAPDAWARRGLRDRGCPPGGAPGLKSARWAGGAHVERVLEALDGVEPEAEAALRLRAHRRCRPRGERRHGHPRGPDRRRMRGEKASASTRSSVPDGERTVAVARQRVEGRELASRPGRPRAVLNHPRPARGHGLIKRGRGLPQPRPRDDLSRPTS